MFRKILRAFIAALVHLLVLFGAHKFAYEVGREFTHMVIDEWAVTGIESLAAWH